MELPSAKRMTQLPFCSPSTIGPSCTSPLAKRMIQLPLFGSPSR